MRLGQRSAAAGVVLRDRPAGGILLVSTAQGTVGRDARELVWELGRERLSEDDVVCQPVQHRYVRPRHAHGDDRGAECRAPASPDRLAARAGSVARGKLGCAAAERPDRQTQAQQATQQTRAGRRMSPQPAGRSHRCSLPARSAPSTQSATGPGSLPLTSAHCRASSAPASRNSLTALRNPILSQRTGATGAHRPRHRISGPSGPSRRWSRSAALGML